MEKTEAGPGWKLWPASTILLITAVVAFHLMLMACICFGIKKTCWVCRKSAGRVQKGWKQVSEDSKKEINQLTIKLANQAEN